MANLEPTSSPPQTKEPSAYAYAALRFLGVLALAGALALAAYFQPVIFNGEVAGERTIAIGFLLAVPYCVGAFASLLADRRGEKDAAYHGAVLPLSVVLVAVVAGGLLLREGVICILMLAPIWLVMSALGGLTIHLFHRRLRARAVVHASAFATLAALAMLFPADLLTQSRTYVVERSIEIDAPVDKIWPLLFALEDITPNEGARNITQDILQVPRPVSAVVRIDGDAPVRFAVWEEGIQFEEHVTRIVSSQQLDWDFHFPDASLAQHVDRHINPAGEHLNMQSGGYRLTSTAKGSARLTLYTRLNIHAPVNAYAGLWARFMLGDIQNNILHIVKSRAEKRHADSDIQ